MGVLQSSLSPKESIYHQMGEGNEGNRKYVSPDGQSEAVFSCSDDLVTDVANAGTYNFFGPRYMKGIPHALTDVLPYYVLGSSPSDMFNPQRFTTTMDVAVNSVREKISLPTINYGGYRVW